MPDDILPPPAVPEAPVVEPPAVPPEPPASGVKEPKLISMPSGALVTVKREAREQGRRQARSEMEAMAKKLGFRSLEEMEQAAKENKRLARQSQNQPRRQEPATQQPKTETPPQQPQASGGDRQSRANEREKQRLVEERRRANHARANEEKKRKQLQRELDAREAEHALQLLAVRNGVKDVDYAVHLLRGKLAGKSAKELEGFDEEKFFATELRKTHPYLYGVFEQPADTTPQGGNEGEGGGGAPPPKQQEQVGRKSKADVMKMSRKEFEDYLRSQGMTPPGYGSPS